MIVSYFKIHKNISYLSVELSINEMNIELILQYFLRYILIFNNYEKHELKK